MGDVIRVVKSGDYSLISNYHLKDQRLSWGAKGLLSTMLAFSGEYTPDELENLSNNEITTSLDEFVELEQNGYLTYKKIGDEAGCPLLEYMIYEKPIVRNSSLDSVAEIMDPEDMPGSSEDIDEEEKKLCELRERLAVEKLKKGRSKYLVECIFHELCRRDEDFRNRMTTKTFEKICDTALKQRIEYWERNNDKECIPLFPVDVVVNIAFDNIEKGFRHKRDER